MEHPTVTNKFKAPPSIWLLAAGYFLFYTPYSAMTKALSKGLLPGSTGSISGFELLPTVNIGTVIMFLLIISGMGWWKFAGRVKFMGVTVPFASSKWTFLSGIAAATIIATTTLAYTFEGISIVFAALLMRGGVLLMAPLMDTFFNRTVRWYSWVAFGLSFIALIMLFSEKGGYFLTLIAALNILIYLFGYFFRLQFMTGQVKINNKQVSYQFFIEEMLVAMLVLLLVPAALALIGTGIIPFELREGFTKFIRSNLAIPALIIGALYACLYSFGTRIYLNNRENTFCIPVNRCASLLAGVAASFILGFIFQASFVSGMQLASACLLIISILFLSYPAFSKKERAALSFIPTQNYVFVCSGNTSRSPMAHAICVEAMKKNLLRRGIDFGSTNIKIWSAGLTAEPAQPMSENAKTALKELKIPIVNHVSKNLQAEDVQEADRIFCMSSMQKERILQEFPQAADKVECLSSNGAINNPAGASLKTYMDCAKEIQALVRKRVIQPAFSIK